jgi:serine/threonine protein kinase
MVAGLRWLFRAGYVHRDLSLGNLLRVKINVGNREENVVQLTDFEYAKPIHSHRNDESWKTVRVRSLDTDMR